jgi:hypothetical protein
MTMVELEEAAKLATMAIPGPGPDEGAVRAFDGMPIAELAMVWCALQRVSLRDKTGGTWDAVLYFDRLPHDAPERAFELMLEVLRSETEKSVLMQLNDKMTPALLYAQGPKMIERIEAEAQTNGRLRWLIGGVYGGDLTRRARLGSTPVKSSQRSDSGRLRRQENSIEARDGRDRQRWWLR